eukprot:scaffold178785_cov14-Tisochrysis_lutea.AAC.1
MFKQGLMGQPEESGCPCPDRNKPSVKGRARQEHTDRRMRKRHGVARLLPLQVSLLCHDPGYKSKDPTVKIIDCQP